MKREVEKVSLDNSFGVASVVLGILSILFTPFNGIILGIISLIFSKKQEKTNSNKWSRAGRILAVIGIILGAVLAILIIVGIKLNPSLFSNFQQ